MDKEFKVSMYEVSYKKIDETMNSKIYFILYENMYSDCGNIKIENEKEREDILNMIREDKELDKVDIEKAIKWVKEMKVNKEYVLYVDIKK